MLSDLLRRGGSKPPPEFVNWFHSRSDTNLSLDIKPKDLMLGFTVTNSQSAPPIVPGWNRFYSWYTTGSYWISAGAYERVADETDPGRVVPSDEFGSSNYKFDIFTYRNAHRSASSRVTAEYNAMKSMVPAPRAALKDDLVLGAMSILSQYSVGAVTKDFIPTDAGWIKRGTDGLSSGSNSLEDYRVLADDPDVDIEVGVTNSYEDHKAAAYLIVLTKP